MNSEGVIYVNGSLDYEFDEKFTFLVRISDVSKSIQ